MGRGDLVNELIGKAMERAIPKVTAGEEFSLVGFYKPRFGGLVYTHINAKDDDDMFRQAKDRGKSARAIGLALMGTGQLVHPKDGTTIDALFLYVQGPGQDEVVHYMTPYSVEPWEEGHRLAMGDWKPLRVLPESWLK